MSVFVNGIDRKLAGLTTETYRQQQQQRQHSFFFYTPSTLAFENLLNFAVTNVTCFVLRVLRSSSMDVVVVAVAVAVCT